MEKQTEIIVEEEFFDTSAGKYKVTTLETVEEFDDNGMLENNFIILTKMTIDRFLKEENPDQLIALYTFYYYTAKWQKTNSIKCTTSYAGKGLGWNERKIMKVKKQLMELGLIEDISRRDKNGKISGHFIKINYVIKNTTISSHPVKKPHCGKNHTVEKKQTNALSDINKNALNTNNKILSESAPADSQDNISSPKKEIDNILEKPILDSNIVTLEIGGRKETYDIQDTNSLELELNKNIEKISKSDKDIINLLGRIYLLNYLLKYKSNFRNNLYPRDYKNIKTMFLDYGKTGAKDLLLYSMEHWKDIKSNLKIVKQIPSIDLISKYRQEIEFFRQKEIQATNKKQGEW